jgi:hypothetical protein
MGLDISMSLHVVVPSLAVINFSSIEYSAWTLRGDHKSWPYVLRVITGDKVGREGEQQKLVYMRKTRRGRVCNVGERRRYYRLTELGQRAFTTELQRYSQVVSIAEKRSLLPEFSLEQGL